MKQNKNAVRYAILIAAAIVVVALAAVMGVLRQTGVIDTKLNSFMLLFVIMAFGFGAIMTASGVYTKSGYELMAGLTLIDIGLALLLGGLKVHVAVTVIVVIAVLIVAVLAPVLSSISLYVFFCIRSFATSNRCDIAFISFTVHRSSKNL